MATRGHSRGAVKGGDECACPRCGCDLASADDLGWVQGDGRLSPSVVTCPWCTVETGRVAAYGFDPAGRLVGPVSSFVLEDW